MSDHPDPQSDHLATAVPEEDGQETSVTQPEDAAAEATEAPVEPTVEETALEPVAQDVQEPVPDAPPAEAPAVPQPPDEESLRVAEALIFSSAAPVTPRALSQILPDNVDSDAVIEALRARYAGRGVELVDAGGGVQFRTTQDLAPRLRKVVEVPRRLPRVAMETLAIIAYHQPITRPEIEEIRGTALSQQTLDALLEANLVAPKGRRESPGRPTLWGTTPQFLAQFGLGDLRDLPRREDLLLEPPQPAKEPQAEDGQAPESAGEPRSDQPGEPSEPATEAGQRPAPEKQA